MDDIKGKGVKTTRAFKRGELVCEYFGDLIDKKTAAAREKEYENNDKDVGCYMYWFSHKNTDYWYVIHSSQLA